MWYLEKLPARGALIGSNVLSTFEGLGFETEEHLFVREASQNSVDNPCSPAHKTKIVIRKCALTDLPKKNFLKTLELRELYGNAGLIARAPEYSELRTVAIARSLGVLFFEDFNTTGLDGALDDPRGNWMRFNLYGDGTKLEEAEKIGSYGLGKSVLARSSGTNTFVVYTTFKDRDGTLHARLMAHTFQPWFTDGELNRSGRGWFCKAQNTADDPIPFSGDEAHSIAEQLGFTSRRNGETGTSFLLIGTSPGKAPISIEEIRRAFETWWWPSLLDNRLDIELWDEKQRIQGPAPRLRSDLLPYIDCKGKLDGAISDDVAQVNFQREYSKDIGRIALKLAADDQMFSYPLHDRAPGPRRVARMRANSGMITEYKEYGTAKRVAFVGFYRGSQEIDQVLKFAEPKEHDTWSQANQRLSRIANGKQLVAAIHDRTQSASYNFQRTNSDVQAPTADRLPQLERLLGAAFKDQGGTAKKRNKVIKENKIRATKIDFPGYQDGRVVPIFGRGFNKLDFLVRYTLRSDIKTKRKVSTWFGLHVAEDADGVKGESLPIEIINQLTRSSMVKFGDLPKITFELSPGKPRMFRIRSEKYDKHKVILFDEGEVLSSELSHG